MYQANRSATVDASGRAIDGGGENTIAVYSINQQTGEPTLIQSADTRGAEPRTFALDPSARILVAANQTAIFTGAGANMKTIPASLTVFRVGANGKNDGRNDGKNDGKLDFANKYDVDTSHGTQFWMGIVPLP